MIRALQPGPAKVPRAPQVIPRLRSNFSPTGPEETLIKRPTQAWPTAIPLRPWEYVPDAPPEPAGGQAAAAHRTVEKGVDFLLLGRAFIHLAPVREQLLTILQVTASLSPREMTINPWSDFSRRASFLLPLPLWANNPREARELRGDDSGAKHPPNFTPKRRLQRLHGLI